MKLKSLAQKIFCDIFFKNFIFCRLKMKKMGKIEIVKVLMVDEDFLRISGGILKRK